MSEKISDLILERYVAGVATADEAARVEASPEALARAKGLARENTELLAAHPPAQVAARVVRGAATRPSQKGTRPLLWLAPLVATACAVAIFALPREQVDVTRAKGGKAKLTIYRQVGSTSEKLEDGAVARAGDTVQVAYIAGENTYGAIVSVDGRSNVTVHTPLTDDGKLSQRGEVLLPRAYVLDDAPRFERFVFVAGGKPVDVSRLRELLHATPELDGEKLRQALNGTVNVFTLRKEP